MATLWEYLPRYSNTCKDRQMDVWHRRSIAAEQCHSVCFPTLVGHVPATHFCGASYGYVSDSTLCRSFPCYLLEINRYALFFFRGSIFHLSRLNHLQCNAHVHRYGICTTFFKKIYSYSIGIFKMNRKLLPPDVKYTNNSRRGSQPFFILRQCQQRIATRLEE